MLAVFFIGKVVQFHRFGREGEDTLLPATESVKSNEKQIET
jgi:hypothetical protein